MKYSLIACYKPSEKNVNVLPRIANGALAISIFPIVW